MEGGPDGWKRVVWNAFPAFALRERPALRQLVCQGGCACLCSGSLSIARTHAPNHRFFATRRQCEPGPVGVGVLGNRAGLALCTPGNTGRADRSASRLVGPAERAAEPASKQLVSPKT